MTIAGYENTGIKIKGVGDGLRVVIPSGLSFELLRPELEKEFIKLKKLAENARIHIESDQGVPDQELVLALDQVAGILKYCPAP